MTDDDKLKQIIFQHPSITPDELYGPPRLVEAPSQIAPTARLVRFREQMRALMIADPDDPDWPRFVAAVDAALAWRQCVPPGYRFWYGHGELLGPSRWCTKKGPASVPDPLFPWA